VDQTARSARADPFTKPLVQRKQLSIESRFNMQEGNWITLAAAACDHAGIRSNSFEIVGTWKNNHQNLVCRLDAQRYLKLYSREPQRQFRAESCALHVLERHGIPAPRLLAAASPEGLPPYIVTTAVTGASAEHTWDKLSRAEQLTLAHEFGVITAAYHQLPQQQLAAVEDEVGGGNESIAYEREQRLAEIEASPMLSESRRMLYESLPTNRDSLVHFISRESPEHFRGPVVFSHCDLSHAHLFVSDASGHWQVSGVIDWAETMLVPSEWDLTFHWFWTFTRDPDAMKACLKAYFNDFPPPDRFARRCFAAYLHTYDWVALWSALRNEFAFEPNSGTLDCQMTEFLFPPEVFGSPD
jgi:hypothetical protein